MSEIFVLLDDARREGAGDARLYRAPSEIVIARSAEEVVPALARIEQLAAQGLHLAGYLAYEAGLALEPRLAGRLPGRTGVTGPLVWFGAFAGYETIAALDVPDWLARHAPPGRVGIGPLEPQITTGDYERVFSRIHGAIEAGDIYQANLTFPLAGPWHGDPLAL